MSENLNIAQMFRQWTAANKQLKAQRQLIKTLSHQIEKHQDINDKLLDALRDAQRQAAYYCHENIKRECGPELTIQILDMEKQNANSNTAT